MIATRLPAAVRCLWHGTFVERSAGPAAWHAFFAVHARCILVAIVGHRLRAVGAVA